MLINPMSTDVGSCSRELVVSLLHCIICRSDGNMFALALFSAVRRLNSVLYYKLEYILSALFTYFFSDNDKKKQGQRGSFHKKKTFIRCRYRRVLWVVHPSTAWISPNCPGRSLDGFVFSIFEDTRLYLDGSISMIVSSSKSSSSFEFF